MRARLNTIIEENVDKSYITFINEINQKLPAFSLLPISSVDEVISKPDLTPIYSTASTSSSGQKYTIHISSSGPVIDIGPQPIVDFSKSNWSTNYSSKYSPTHIRWNFLLRDPEFKSNYGSIDTIPRFFWDKAEKGEAVKIDRFGERSYLHLRDLYSSMGINLPEIKSSGSNGFKLRQI